MNQSVHNRGGATEPVVPNTGGTLDLTRFCLEPDAAESQRRLAWVNAICLGFLIIGLIGLKTPVYQIVRRLQPQDEAVPTVIEPLVAAVQTVTADTPAETPASERSSDEGGAVVAVVADSAEVAFSVPTVGNVLVSMGMAQAPPANPMQGVVQLNAPRIETISATGIGGSRPPPPYPRDSLQRKEQGKVVLLFEVDEVGKITSIEVKESSGYATLDRATLDYIRRHWFFEPGKEKRRYESPIVYQLE